MRIYQRIYKWCHYYVMAMLEGALMIAVLFARGQENEVILFKPYGRIFMRVTLYVTEKVCVALGRISAGCVARPLELAKKLKEVVGDVTLARTIGRRRYAGTVGVRARKIAKRRYVVKIKRRCGYAGQRIGEASHPGPSYPWRW